MTTVEDLPISAGVKGGLAGALPSALIAALYGLVSHGSICCPINLLAGSLYAPSAMPSVGDPDFRLSSFLFALALHLATSLLVGPFVRCHAFPCFLITLSCWAV